MHGLSARRHPQAHLFFLQFGMLPFALFLLGLGFLLTGMSMLSESLKRLGGQAFRRLATRYMSPRWKALLFGLGAGALMQSTSAALVTLASLNCIGGLSVPQAMSILTGFCVGSCVLPFIVSFKIKTGVFLAVGFSAILLHFTKGDRRRNILSLAFGLGLIFFGIEMMLEGVAPLRTEPWLAELMRLSGAWPLATIAVSAVLGLVLQSSTTVTLVAIGLIKGGVMTVPQALPVMYGAIIGSSLFRMLVGSAFRGSGRQLFRFMDLYNYLGAGIFIVLYFVETMFGVPLVIALLPHLSPAPQLQAAWAFLLISLTSATILTILQTPLAVWLDRTLPPSEEEDLWTPRYIGGAQGEDPHAALALIQKEQLRELDHIVAFFAAARDGYTGLGLEARSKAFEQLALAVDSATTAAAALNFGHETAREQVYLQTRQTLIRQLADSALELLKAIRAARALAEIAPLAENCFEAVDFLFMTAVEQLQCGKIDPAMYADRGTQMEQLRAAYFKDGQALSVAGRSGLVSLTTGVEKCVWVLNRLLKFGVPAESGK